MTEHKNIISDDMRECLKALEQERQERDKRIEEAAIIKQEIEERLPSF